jgi:hypothetical protein
MKFELIDNTRKDIYNESCRMEKFWYGEQEDGQVMDIETYYIMCKEFAAAMGFQKERIEEWFGTY